jgi:hypothetical protein
VVETGDRVGGAAAGGSSADKANGSARGSWQGDHEVSILIGAGTGR